MVQLRKLGFQSLAPRPSNGYFGGGGRRRRRLVGGTAVEGRGRGPGAAQAVTWGALPGFQTRVSPERGGCCTNCRLHFGVKCGCDVECRLAFLCCCFSWFFKYLTPIWTLRNTCMRKDSQGHQLHPRTVRAGGWGARVIVPSRSRGRQAKARPQNPLRECRAACVLGLRLKGFCSGLPATAPPPAPHQDEN